MFERLDYLARMPIGQALDVLMEEFDEALLAGQFKEVDTYLKHAIVHRYRPETLVGFLTVTFVWRDQLEERAGFFDRVKVHLTAKFPDRVEKILMGLEG